MGLAAEAVRPTALLAEEFRQSGVVGIAALVRHEFPLTIPAVYPLLYE